MVATPPERNVHVAEILRRDAGPARFDRRVVLVVQPVERERLGMHGGWGSRPSVVKNAPTGTADPQLRAVPPAKAGRVLHGFDLAVVPDEAALFPVPDQIHVCVRPF